MRNRAIHFFVGIFATYICIVVGQDEFLDEENRFRDTQNVSNSDITISSSWPTGFCGYLRATNPVDPAAIWNATLNIQTATFKVIGDVWGDAIKLENTSTGTGSSNILVPDKDRAVKMVDEDVELNICMGVDTDYVVSGQNLSDYLPGLALELAVDFT